MLGVSARADFFSKCCIWKEARICCCNTKLVNSPHLWMCLIPNTHKRTALFLEEAWTKLKRSCYLVFTHADGVRKNFYQWSTLFAFHPFIQLLHHSLVLTWILFFRPFVRLSLFTLCHKVRCWHLLVKTESNLRVKHCFLLQRLSIYHHKFFHIQRTSYNEVQHYFKMCVVTDSSNVFIHYKTDELVS